MAIIGILSPAAGTQLWGGVSSQHQRQRQGRDGRRGRPVLSVVKTANMDFAAAEGSATAGVKRGWRVAHRNREPQKGASSSFSS